MVLVSAQDFNFFALGGPVVSQIDGDHFGGYNKMGAVFGVGVSHDINTEWSALMELEYIQKGKGSYNADDGSTNKIVLNYFQLPLLINYHLLDNFSIESGISLGYLFSDKFYQNGEINTHPIYTPYFYDIDWLLGATYTLSDEWKLNLRFSYSIIPMGNIYENPEDFYRPNFWRQPGGQYNNSLAVAAQYWF